MPRLLLVSNRLPVTIHLREGEISVARSTGGLATGLFDPHERSGGTWIGWPGDTSSMTDAQRAEVDRQLSALRLAPIHLTRHELEGFYEGFSNRVLWPLFHYQLDHIPLEALGWELYTKVNARFADAVVAHYRPGDTIWVHDYQLCLVPGMLRERLPDARIGFFLHIPFPSSEVIQALPWRNALLEGLLGADVVGFHTYPYLRHFANALLRLMGAHTEVDRAIYRGREIRLGAFPMGIDAARFDQQAREPETLETVRQIQADSQGQHLFLGVDRLDYTKGIRRRILGLGRLLEKRPELSGKIKLVQIAVPSRSTIAEYEEFRQEVDEVVGRVNGAHATTRWTPVHYFYRGFSQRELTAFYRAADVMLVTPLRDGMNLVAKEFVACREDEQGVLLLSELAGASAELGEAMMVNPYDVDGLADAMWRALHMSPKEQHIRMRALRHRVLSADVHHWVKSFLEALEAAPKQTPATPLPLTPRREMEALAKRIAAAPGRLFLLDCDGTLFTFNQLPALVTPDPELRRLLRELAAFPNTTVQLVSGRPQYTLEEWFGDLPVGLHAEHGLWSRMGPEQTWVRVAHAVTDWKERVRPLLINHALRTPGSFLEEKSGALAWHYRMADPEYGQLQAQELVVLLKQNATDLGVEVLAGEKVVEVRTHGVSKGLIVAPGVKMAGPNALVVAMGDDRTDEDMFAALPEGGIAIHVGPRESRAPYRLRDPVATRAFLEDVLKNR